MRSILLLFASLLSVSTFAQQGTWTTRTSLPATARAFSYTFSMGDTAYVCGGANLGVTQTDFWAYHPVSDTWVQKNSPAFQSRQGGCFVVNGKAYLFLGIKSGSTQPNAEVWEYDPVTDAWTQKNNFPGGPRLSCYAFAIGNKGYMGGGSNAQPGGMLYDFWEYDPNTDVWTQIPNYPIPDYFGFGTFVLNGQGYLVGGFGSGSPATIPVNRVWCFNPATNQWTQKNNFPINLGSTTGFTAAGNGYIVNGTTQLGSNQQKINDLYKYDAVTDTWTQDVSFPGSVRSNTHALVVNDIVYAGHGLGLSATYYADWYRFVPAGVTAVEEFAANEAFVLFPNPADASIQVEMEGRVNAPLQITDVNGRVVLQQENAFMSADVSGLPDGVYVVTVGDRHQRLVVQH